MINVDRSPARRNLALATAGALVLGAVAAAAPASAAPPTAGTAATLEHPSPPTAPSTSQGYGGAVSSVDADASSIGLDVLRNGGNAADAAVATAAALGVTEPYSAGIGGGGFFVYFDAETGEVSTIDGRETAPAGMQSDAFVDPATGQPYPFDDAVSSGLSVGVPGTLATWEGALERFGTRSLAQTLAPSIRLAARGFEVDEEFVSQTADNQERFAAFPATAELFLPGGAPPAVGSTFRNPDLAKTLLQIAVRGTDVFYDGAIADEIAALVQQPQVSPDATLPAYPGTMTAEDIRGYGIIDREPTLVEYHGLDVYGMAPVSSGGTTVGESLNILEDFDLSPESTVESLHLYLEATAHAFADRNAYVGDPAFVDVPTETLLSQGFADARACVIDPAAASVKPVPPAPLTASGCATAPAEAAAGSEGPSTTHLSVVDKWGNAVAYTLTIEETGGSGMTVPGRGFLLNNELTDFTFTSTNPTEPNLPAPGKRPRSSMSPTIVLDDGEVRLVLGSPGGSTIITTVTQVLLNRLDLGMTLPEAVAAPRATQRNTPLITAEPAFKAEWGAQLEAYGHRFNDADDPIGAVAAIEVDGDGLMTAVAEPVRRGGGVGLVVDPSK